MVVYSWPPRGGVGMIRSLKFAKYLPEFGWMPTVLTPQEAPSQLYCKEEEGCLDGVRVVKTGYTTVWRRAKGFVVPDEAIGWYSHAVKSGMRLLEEEHFDAVYSSSPPETAHLVAKKLSQARDLPWLADLRDPWSDYHHFKPSAVKSAVNRIIEKATLKQAAHLVTVSDVWADLFRERYSKEVSAITNGFDEDDFLNIDNMPSDHKEFVIAYAGKMHKRFQDPEALFAALKDAIEGGAIPRDRVKIRIYMFGSNQPDLALLEKKYGLSGMIEVRRPIGYRECLKELSKSSLLLLVDWGGDDRIARGVMPAKVFDYLRTGRAILLLGAKKDSELRKVIESTSAGYICSNKDDTKNALVDAFEKFNKGEGLPSGNCEKIARFSRRSLTGRLANILTGLR